MQSSPPLHFSRGICFIICITILYFAYIVKIICTGEMMSSYSYNILKHKQIEDRAIEIANYIVETGATVRQTAKNFGISKSTVHKDVTERLPSINQTLAESARSVLNENKAQRHIRGGLATKEKYLNIKCN